MTKIVTIVGARPQFIKAAVVSRAIRDKYATEIEEVLIHTGQHYDSNMSQTFFDELAIPAPRYNLGIAAGLHGAMTGRMLEATEALLLEEQPDWVLVYGDTNSTLAGALAASKLHLPVAHVEAGLRSFNMRMPEEINRILADRVSTRLFCPTISAVENLAREGLTTGVSLVGDVMYDATLYYRDLAREKSTIIKRFDLSEGGYVLVTCHRAENTDHPDRLREICLALADLAVGQPVIFPVHPRTARAILDQGLASVIRKVKLVDPLPYLDMIRLEMSAGVILTDSGGVQKESFFFRVPCVTMRDETEWVETVEQGWNVIAGASRQAIVKFASNPGRPEIADAQPYGNGQAGEIIIASLIQ